MNTRGGGGKPQSGASGAGRAALCMRINIIVKKFIIPFMIRRDVQRGVWYGLFYDAPCCGEFDLGAERSGYWPRYCKISLETDRMDYYVLLGGSMREIIRLYTDLTGKTAMPPLASLGHMASTMYLTELENHCDRAIGHFIDQLHERGFCCDGYLF